MLQFLSVMLNTINLMISFLKNKNLWENTSKAVKTSGLFPPHSYHKILSSVPKAKSIFFVCFIRKRFHRQEIKQIMQLAKAVKMHTPKQLLKRDTK
jgi:hypothetical protein